MIAVVLVRLPGSVLADPAEVPQYFDRRPASGRRTLEGKVIAFPLGEAVPLVATPRGHRPGAPAADPEGPPARPARPRRPRRFRGGVVMHRGHRDNRFARRLSRGHAISPPPPDTRTRGRGGRTPSVSAPAPLDARSGASTSATSTTPTRRRTQVMSNVLVKQVVSGVVFQQVVRRMVVGISDWPEEEGEVFDIARVEDGESDEQAMERGRSYYGPKQEVRIESKVYFEVV